MPVSRQADPETEADPWREFYDELANCFWQPALRFALDADRAAERCGRRACKLAGECRMVVREGQPLDCGGGLSKETLVSACGHVLFGCIVVRRIAEDNGLSPFPPGDPERREAAAAAPRAVSRRRKDG